MWQKQKSHFAFHQKSFLLKTTVTVVKMSISSCVHDPITPTSNTKTFLQYFYKFLSILLENLKDMYRRYIIYSCKYSKLIFSITH